MARYIVIFRALRPVEARTTVEAESPEEAERKAAEAIDWDWDTLNWQYDYGGEIETVAVRDVYTEPGG